MPIRRYITVEMESAEIKRLNSAYAKALRMLDLSVAGALIGPSLFINPIVA